MVLHADQGIGTASSRIQHLHAHAMTGTSSRTSRQPKGAIRGHNKKIAADVLEAVGGKSNVSFATHCMTRLRLTLKDRTIPDVDAIKKIDGVLGAQGKAGGQF